MGSHKLAKKAFRRKMELLDQYISSPCWENWLMYKDHGQFSPCIFPIQLADDSLRTLFRRVSLNDFYYGECKITDCPYNMASCDCLLLNRLPSTYLKFEGEVLRRAILFREKANSILGI